MPIEDEDEIINVRLPRKDYELMRKMIQREHVFSWLERTFKASAIWVIAGGILSVILLWDKLVGMIK